MRSRKYDRRRLAPRDSNIELENSRHFSEINNADVGMNQIFNGGNKQIIQIFYLSIYLNYFNYVLYFDSSVDE